MDILFCYQGAAAHTAAREETEELAHPDLISRSRMHRAIDSIEMKRSGIEIGAGVQSAEDLRGQLRKLDNRRLPVLMRLRDTPVPIPNTMVKT